MSKDLEFESRCIHLQQEDKSKRYGAISFPIYQTATFAHPGLGESTGYDYSRVQNPTREHLEKIIASLEHGLDAIAYSCGMSAIANVLELFAPGDHIIADLDLYGGSTRMFKTMAEKRGISFSYIDFSQTDVTPFIKKETKAFFIETPTNPMMKISDIAALAEKAHENHALLIVDNTFLSPYLQNPLDLGADIVVHSGTKYLSGHNDTLAGFTVVRDEELAGQLRFSNKTAGANLSAFDSWLVIRGIQTLAVRMEKAQENAMILAKWLKTQSIVSKVIYPGLKEHPGYELNRKQARGAGAMLTFDVNAEENVAVILKKIQLIQYAESLGGTETLLTYPLTQTHADVSREVLEANGLNACTLRMSVGIENVNDLIADLQQAFESEEICHGGKKS